MLFVLRALIAVAKKIVPAKDHLGINRKVVVCVVSNIFFMSDA